MRKLLFFLILLPFSAYAQPAKLGIGDSVINARIFSVSLEGQLPAADLAKRFGPSLSPGFSFMFKFGNDWLLGIEGDYLYGHDVKEDSGILRLTSTTGYFIGTDGLYDNVDLSEVGYMVYAKFGRVIPILGSNPNSGLMLLAGGGFMQDKISINDVNGTIPYLDGAYAKGYDRLTNGVLVDEFVGYMHLDKHKLVNFYAGIDIMEGFTQNRRSWNFDQMKQDTQQRLDMLIGLKLGWMLPFYAKNLEKFYTN
jgi:hypothetical protein